MKPLYFKGRVVPVWLICLLIVPLTISVAYAASSIDTSGGDNISTIGGEVVTVAEDLSCTPGDIGVAPSGGLAAAGASDGDEQIMDDVGTEAANELLVEGQFTYECTVAVVAGGESDTKEYTAALTVDGSPHGTLYFEQAASSVAGDDIDLTWDLGASLPGGVYVITVEPQ